MSIINVDVHDYDWIKVVARRRVSKHPGLDGSPVHSTGTDQSVHGAWATGAPAITKDLIGRVKAWSTEQPPSSFELAKKLGVQAPPDPSAPEEEWQAWRESDAGRAVQEARLQWDEEWWDRSPVKVLITNINPDAPYDERRRQYDEWASQVRRAFTFGVIDREVAELLDREIQRLTGSYNLSVMRAITDGGATWEHWKELDPQKRYLHVTTSASSLERDGWTLRTRRELGGYEPGLGGGPDQTISLTVDEQIALDIQRALREAIPVARGEVTPQDLLETARREGFDREFGRLLVPNPDEWESDGRPFRPEVKGLERLFGLRRERPITPVPISELPEGSVVVQPWTDHQDMAIEWLRPVDDERRNAWRLFKWWLRARDIAGGPKDPYIYHDNVDVVASLNPDDVKVVAYRPRSGAQGVEVGGLGEIRLFDGDALVFDGIVEE